MENELKVEMSAQLEPSQQSVAERLTGRQREVLQLLCEGLQNKQIARRLNIASATVKIHVANIFHTLNVSTRLEAVIVAINLGLAPESAGAEPEQARSLPAAARPATVLRLVSHSSEPAKGGQHLAAFWGVAPVRVIA